jgi:hypothetical protein
MGSPQKRKSLLKGIEVPWRLRFQNLQMACFHGHLLKVRVLLKVDRKTELFEDQNKNRAFWGNVQKFYLADMVKNLRFELVIASHKAPPPTFRFDTECSVRSIPAGLRISVSSSPGNDILTDLQNVGNRLSIHGSISFDTSGQALPRTENQTLADVLKRSSWRYLGVNHTFCKPVRGSREDFFRG